MNRKAGSRWPSPVMMLPTVAANDRFDAARVAAHPVLWSFDVGGPPTAEVLAALSDDERDRFARFVFERDRQWFANRRWALRRVLGALRHERPSTIRFGHDRYGRPELAADDVRGLSFNTSHSAGMALIGAVRNARIGVDIEVIRRLDDFRELVGATLSPVEKMDFQMNDDDAKRRFLRAWTLKEAYLKAIGLGLSIPPTRVETRASPDGTATVWCDATGIDSMTAHWGLVGATWIAAVVTVPWSAV